MPILSAHRIGGVRINKKLAVSCYILKIICKKIYELLFIMAVYCIGKVFWHFQL